MFPNWYIPTYHTSQIKVWCHDNSFLLTLYNRNYVKHSIKANGWDNSSFNKCSSELKSNEYQKHSVKITEIFCHSDFTLNQFPITQDSEPLKRKVADSNLLEIWNWFHIKSEWQENPEISTSWKIDFISNPKNPCIKHSKELGRRHY